MDAFEVMAQKLKSLCKEDLTFCDTNGLPSSELLQLSNSEKKSHSNSDKKSQYSVRRYEYEESGGNKNQVKIVLLDGKPIRYFIRDKFRITLDDNCEIKNTTQLAMHLDAPSCKESEDAEVKSFCQALGILSRPYYSPTPNPRGMPTSPPSIPVPNPTGRKTGS